MGKEQQQATIARLYEDSVDSRRKKRDGVVVTPLEVVDFQIWSVLQQLQNQGYQWTDPRIEYLDPFGGTGIFLARLIQIVPLPPAEKLKVARRCILLEIDPKAAQIAADNLAIVRKEETGVKGQIRVLCVDTFKIPPDADLWDFSMDRFLVNPMGYDEGEPPSSGEIAGGLLSSQNYYATGNHKAKTHYRTHRGQSPACPLDY